ncbi:HAD-like protein [Schizopora paradoxa]|uniref:HAD-like protein n=1 Tax=Schizopora paradoxa TaxID=27342 RepID=A0A0H2RQL0_9AGAM|nr:HAD-like protein [Schizopora paradoxa]
MIRLVLFDALFTLVAPRKPISTQYAEAFKPFFGTLDEGRIKSEFKRALKQLETERPAYEQGHETWWADVIRRTAVGAGAPAEVVEHALPTLVPGLLKRFSSREGYKLYDDALPTLKALQSLGIPTGLASNCDDRMISALEDLDALTLLSPNLILSSASLRVAKPAPEFFKIACERTGFSPNEILHVGDDPDDDYAGARSAGLRALLLAREAIATNASTPTLSGVMTNTSDEKEAIQQAQAQGHIIRSLSEVVDHCFSAKAQ